MALFSLHGIGVSRGCAIGRAIRLQRDQPEVLEYVLPAALIEDEAQRFLDCLAKAKAQLIEIRDRVAANFSNDITAFIDTHLLMLEDSTLTKGPLELIRSRHCNAEWALKLQRDRVVQIFEEMDDPYLRNRKDDVDHVVTRIQRILLSDDTSPADFGASRFDGHIVIADDLTPADTILIQHQGVLAFVTEYGGPLSHTAILARNLEIPAVVGARSARRVIRDDELIVVDGEQGVVVGGLDEDTLAYYRRIQKEERTFRDTLARLNEQPAVSLDGVTLELYANIELPEDAAAVNRVGAAGVGLYRTEFMFMNRTDIPDEDEHLADYLHVLKALEGRPLTIRTLDLGADKQVDGGRSSGPVATNPALGLRAIRLCLKEPELFRPQLRAILRASAFGPVRMMIPMLSNTHELFQVLRMVDAVKIQLREQNFAFDETMPIGGMIEVPAAAISAPTFARYLDFLSIGTNDLIQYTLAVDRIDDEVNYLYDPLHPAVLQLIHRTIAAGAKAGIPVALCGEMAGERRYTPLLLGLGLTQFSMHPASLLEVKHIIRTSHVAELTRKIHRLLKTTDAERFADRIRDIVPN